MILPRRVRLAIFTAFLCHGLFILTARYRLSYDAFTHMLFANHYAEHWFSFWEPRWYSGFTVVSYPPLAHQLIAIFIPVLGFDRAFALILWLITTLYPLGVYAFSRVFIGKTTASYAALASAVLPPIYVTAHIFGQLPFLTSTLLALFSAANLNRYLREGGLLKFLLTISLYTTTMAAHHATMLVHPFLISAVLANLWLGQGTAKNSFRIAQLSRFTFFVIVAITASFVVIFPFWQWGQTQSLQTPIDHLSRHNFITDPFAILIFFLPLYGLFALIIPFIFAKWHPRFLGLRFAFITLFLLGLGGTTPLPHLLFGSAWEWLTYDRFAFWACLTLTPFFGILFIRLKKKLRLILKPTPATLRKTFPTILTFSLLTATVLGTWFTPYFLRLQPDPIDMQPIVDFLNTPGRFEYRYITFGFGDQFAYLNLLTKATTIDGSYHTARELPELRDSGIGQIDTSYWALNGMNAIVPILQPSGEHGVRWGLVNPATLQAVKIHWGEMHQSPFIPVLEKLGWKKTEILVNGVLVYENPNVQLPDLSSPPEMNLTASIAWGILPVLSLVSTLILAATRLHVPLSMIHRQQPIFPKSTTATNVPVEATRDRYQRIQSE